MPQLTAQLKLQLSQTARQVRVDIIKMLTKAASGHPGGSLGMTDIFVSLYFGGWLNHRPSEPRWEGRDRLVLSNGHICPVLYACLARSGYFPVEWYEGLRQVNEHLQGHPAMHKTPGVEASTGSLGHGFAMSVGMAKALQMDGKPNRVFALLGDGECQEGLVWEAAMAAAHYKLDNLTVIVDRNDAQIDGTTKDVMGVEPFADKWRAFGFHTLDMDGHCFEDIFAVLREATSHRGGPTAIIARTVMGKGVSYMEQQGYQWHGKAPSPAQAEQALKELQPA